MVAYWRLRVELVNYNNESVVYVFFIPITGIHSTQTEPVVVTAKPLHFYIYVIRILSYGTGTLVTEVMLNIF
jgi:hypothetical protein